MRLNRVEFASEGEDDLRREFFEEARIEMVRRAVIHKILVEWPNGDSLTPMLSDQEILLDLKPNQTGWLGTITISMQYHITFIVEDNVASIVRMVPELSPL